MGHQMTGRTLILRGDAGDDLGASMSGGTIHVHGNAGDRIGGPGSTDACGMTGGQIVVHGSAGDHVGLGMRRGLICITGGVGASPGYRMLAGTLVVGQGPLAFPGLEMQRGTIVCLDAQRRLPPHPHLTESGRVEPGALITWLLLQRQLQRLDVSVPTGGFIELFSGDCMERRRGEIWQWAC
jgi:formylmethanofuran dehydrogenase subunit C